MTKKEAVKLFKQNFHKLVKGTDKPAIRQAWNDWTDLLIKGGTLPKRAYDWTSPFK